MQDSGYQSRHEELTLPTLKPFDIPRLERKDSGTITEVCNTGNLPEIEIVSLLEEQIPRYRLRADTYTRFRGYENEDWFIPYPTLSAPDSDFDLSPELAGETLNYFVLCGSRVSQMSKTYNDIDAVSRLLEEKEKDLELAARIGQSLLSRNKNLEERIACLESDLSVSNDKVTQLRHELVMKTELLQIYSSEIDSDTEGDTPTGMKVLNAELLQRKVKSLEDENVSLKAEATQLATDTVDYEEKEEKLVHDVVRQLTDANMQTKILSEELARKVDENLRFQEEITTLLAQVVDLQAVNKRVSVENDELSSCLSAAKDTQSQLTAELYDFKEKYSEIAELLKDTQEQLKRQKKRSQPTARGSIGAAMMLPGNIGGGYTNPDSLASELENSLLGLGVPNDSIKEGTNTMKKIFETYRYASPKPGPISSTSDILNSSGGGGGGYGMGGGGLPYSFYSSGTMHTSSGINSLASGSGQSSMTSSYGPPVTSYATLSTSTQLTPMMSCAVPHVMDGGGSMTSGHYSMTSSLDSTMASDADGEGEEPLPYLGRTQIPSYAAAPDLETALSRLNPQEVYARRQMMMECDDMPGEMGYPYSDLGVRTPPQGFHRDLRTPDSIMSTGSNRSNSSSNWRMPEKLKLVKPMEGSLTLGHWARLATPHMGGIFEERPGVQTKGEKPLSELEDIYTLSDVEEDEEVGTNPGKAFDRTSGIYTYTNSTVMHPEENTMLTNSYGGTHMTAVPFSVSEPSSLPPAPQLNSRSGSRRNSCSTFSTNWGLARMLNERGMGSGAPSGATTPMLRTSPPGTPCNSPDETSPSSQSPESSSREPFFSAFKLPSILSVTRTVTRGADLLRRTFYGGYGDDVIQEEELEEDGATASFSGERPTSPNSGRPLNIKLMERLQKIGIENIIAAPSLTPPPMPGGVYTRRRLPSPMAQLTSLKTIGARRAKRSDASRGSSTTNEDGRMGVPGRPGSGALNKMVNINKILKQRPELGTVGPRRSAGGSGSGNDVGTIHTLKCGRKGGLL